MIRFRAMFLTITIILIFINPHVDAAISPSIAVAPFENINKDPSLDWLSAGIPETVTNSLQSVKGVVLVERMQLRKVMDELKLQYSGMVDEKTAVQLGKLTAANILVIGAFQKSGETVRLTARFLQLETGRVLQTAQATGDLKDIFALQDKIVLGLMKNLNIDISRDELAKLTTAPTESLDAYRHFGQGVLLEARKDYQGAVKELKKATIIDPKFTLAKNKFIEIFLSLNKGNYWTYESKTTSYINNNAVTVIDKSTDIAGEKEYFMGKEAFSYIRESRVKTSNNTTSTRMIHRTYFIKGHDGIYLAGIKSETTMGNNKPILTFIVYDPAYLVYPYEVQIDSKWTSKSSLKSGFNDFASARNVGTYTTNQKIIAMETIKVPSGTFDCYVINYDYKTEFTGIRTSLSPTAKIWFAPGVGMVKYVMEAKNGQTVITTDMVLSEYRIN